MKSSGTCTRQGSHDVDQFVDCWSIIRPGAGIDPSEPTFPVEHSVASELASVGLAVALFQLVAGAKQLDVLLRRLPTPHTPEGPASKAEGPIGLALYVADDGERIGESLPVAPEHPRIGERDHDNLAVAQFVLSSAHGVDVCFAGQSSEMSVQDQHQRLADRIAGLPSRAGVVDQFDVREDVADRQGLSVGSGVHGGSQPTICAVTSHDRPFGRYLEDFEPGDIYKHWPGKTITEADDHLFCMITMNHHPLHTNQWFAENETVHGKNVVVGNLVYSLVLGMSVADVSGAAIANLEIETLRHSKPTFHGDTIYAETRVLSKRESSKGDRGIVEVETKGLNQRGEEVCYFKRKVLVWKQENAPKRQRPYDESIWSED